MNKSFRYLLLIGASLTLAACTCPKKDVYTGGPYAGDTERTAGTGMDVYEGKCHYGDDKQSYPVEEERTAGTGDHMFSKMMHK